MSRWILMILLHVFLFCYNAYVEAETTRKEEKNLKLIMWDHYVLGEKGYAYYPDGKIESIKNLDIFDPNVVKLALNTISNETSVKGCMEKLTLKADDVIAGDWKKPYDAGYGNIGWNSVSKMIKGYMDSGGIRHPVGQCLDFAALTNALARAVGIPSRMITCVLDTGNPGGYRYHMWDEWIDDVPPIKWAVADATPGELHGIGTRDNQTVQDRNIRYNKGVYVYNAIEKTKRNIATEYKKTANAPSLAPLSENIVISINTNEVEYNFGDDIDITVCLLNNSDSLFSGMFTTTVEGCPPLASMFDKIIEYPSQMIDLPANSEIIATYTLKANQYSDSGDYRVKVNFNGLDEYMEFQIIDGLVINLISPESVFANQAFDITMNISNLFPTTINDINVEVLFPTGSNIEDVSFTIPSIEPNKTYTKTWSVSVSELGPNSISAYVFSDDTGSDRADTRVTILGPADIYAVFEPDSITTRTGSVFTITGKVINDGDLPASGIKGTLTLSKQLATTESLLLNIGSIPPNSEVSFTRQIAAMSPGNAGIMIKIMDANGDIVGGVMSITVISLPHDISIRADRNIVTNQDESRITLFITNDGSEEDEIMLDSYRSNENISYSFDDDGMPVITEPIKVPPKSEYRLNLDIYPEELATGSIHIHASSKLDPSAGASIDIDVIDIPSDTSYPGSPGKPIVNAIVNQGSFTLSWTPAHDPDSSIVKHELQRKSGKDGMWITVDGDMSENSFTYSTSNPLTKGQYYYRLRAMNGAGMWGAYSEVSKKIILVDWYSRVNTDTTTLAEYGEYGTISINVPSGGFATSTTLAINRLSAGSILQKNVSTCSDSIWELLALDDENEEKQPAKSLTITLPYNREDADELMYRIYRLNNNIVPAEWKMVTGSQTVNTASNTVTANVSHLSVYGVFLPTQTQIESSSSAETLNNVHAYPNPYKPEKGHDCVYFKNLTQKCLIRIYTVTGELVRDIAVNSPDGTAQWDGKNIAGEDVASEIYIYLITNDKDQRTSGKISVLR
ncbi:MAG: transglutaminase domain-containing protein [bacterium]|nr:transglutaminase domain-containing protein [bacterium]